MKQYKTRNVQRLHYICYYLLQDIIKAVIENDNTVLIKDLKGCKC